jgi:putative flippase GtrA
MSILVGRLGLAIVLANLISVLVCSLLNFILADRVAFKVNDSSAA